MNNEPIYYGKIKHKGEYYDCVFKLSAKEIKITTKKGNLKVTDFEIMKDTLVRIDGKTLNY